MSRFVMFIPDFVGSQAAGSAAGKANNNVKGTSLAAAHFASVGVAAAQAVGHKLDHVVASSAGVGAAASVGRALKPAVGSAAGVAVCLFRRPYSYAVAGVSTVLGVGSAAVKATASAAGVGAVASTGHMLGRGAGSSAGVGAASSGGGSLVPGVASAAGVGATSALTSLGTSFSADGSSVVVGLTSKLVAALAGASGTCTISFKSAIGPSVGTAAGTSDAEARTIRQSVGSLRSFVENQDLTTDLTQEDQLTGSVDTDLLTDLPDQDQTTILEQ